MGSYSAIKWRHLARRHHPQAVDRARLRQPPVARLRCPSLRWGAPKERRQGRNLHRVSLPGQRRHARARAEPRPSIGARLKTAGGSFAEGFKGAFGAENIAAEIPQVILSIADKVAAAEAIKGIRVKFLKEGFAKGVAAGYGVV